MPWVKSNPDLANDPRYLEPRITEINAKLAERAKIIHVEMNVKFYGAIGDGVSHPLSEKYATLSQAQAVYPHAAALTDEIDWCAIQKAINVEKRAHIPDGTFLINRSLLFDGDQITLDGSGREKAIIKTIGAINGIDKSNTTMTKHTSIKNISVWGNNTGIHGIKLINVARLRIENVHVNNFINGVTEYAWVSELDNIYVGATTTGFNIIGGTSTTFKQCYANTATNGFVIGDLDNIYGMNAQILQYSTFINCAADNVSEYGYKVMGAVGVNFINCGSEYVTKGMFYVGTGKNTAGTQIDYNTIVVDNPRALLNNGGTANAECFIKNEGRSNLIEIRGLSDGSIDGNVTKMIDDIVGNSAPIVIRGSNLTYSDKYTTGAFSVQKGSSWGVKGESRQSLPIQSNTNKMLKMTNLAHKTVGNEFELFVYVPNDGDVASGFIELFPLKWNDAQAPMTSRVQFFAQNVAGTVKAVIKDLSGTFYNSTTVQATYGGHTVFRLYLRGHATTANTDPYMVFAEIYSDQITLTQRTFIAK